MSEAIRHRESGFSASQRWRKVFSILFVFGVLVVVWELYKFVWLQAGWIRPIRPDNTTTRQAHYLTPARGRIGADANHLRECDPDRAPGMNGALGFKRTVSFTTSTKGENQWPML